MSDEEIEVSYYLAVEFTINSYLDVNNMDMYSNLERLIT
jgi:hypothetical protein